jgi:hypothetical protein
MRIRCLASCLVLSGMLAGCAAPPAPVETTGGFRRDIIEGDRCAATLRQRYLDPVTRPGLQINQSGGVVVAIQRLPKSVVGASLTTTGHEKGYPRILRAWVVTLNYSGRDIRFGPSVVSLADGAHAHLQLVSEEAPCEAQAMAKRQGTPATGALLQDSLIAPQAFAYGVLFFLAPSDRPLIFPLQLVVRVGDETFEVEFEGAK